MYNNLLKRILFPSLSIYFFHHFFTFFPIPKSKFRRIMGKNGDFFYFENRKFVSLSFHILFSPFLPIPKSKFRCVLGKNGVGPPNLRQTLLTYTVICMHIHKDRQNSITGFDDIFILKMKIVKKCGESVSCSSYQFVSSNYIVSVLGRGLKIVSRSNLARNFPNYIGIVIP